MPLVVALLATPCKWETLLATPSKYVGNGRSLIGLALAILPSSAYVTHCGPTRRYATRHPHCVTQWHPAAPWGSGYARDDDGTTAALDEGRFDGRCLKRRRDEQQVRQRVPKASAPDRCCGGTVPGGWKSSEEGERGPVGTCLPATELTAVWLGGRRRREATGCFRTTPTTTSRLQASTGDNELRALALLAGGSCIGGMRTF